MKKQQSAKPMYKRVSAKIPSIQFADSEIWELNRPYIMGIANITPDSFYDGGTFMKTKALLHFVDDMLSHGVDMIDIGGESSRPGAEPLPIAEERRRVIPKIKILKKNYPDLRISIDTYKSEIAKAALDNGVDIINDISAGEDSNDVMLDVALEHNVPIVLMHKKGVPKTMQKNVSYTNVVQDVYTYLKKRRDILLKQGFPENKIILDVGIGFGKLAEHNIALVKNLAKFKKLGCPLLVGASMKSIIAHICETDEIEERGPGTLGFHLAALLSGAQIIRVHDVKSSLHAIRAFFSVQDF